MIILILYFPFCHKITCLSTSIPPYCVTCFYSVFSSLLSSRCLSGAGLHDLSWWLGQRWSPADVWRTDRQIQPGCLLNALGLHLGYYGHPGCTHPLLLGLCLRESTGWSHVRRAAGRKQGWECTMSSDKNLIFYWSPLGKFLFHLCTTLTLGQNCY